MQVFKGRFDRCRAQCPASAQAGFTLIELMVTLIVLAVLMAIAAPSFTTLSNNNRLTGVTNEMMATLQFARMEAIRRGVPITACRSNAAATACEAGDVWSRWIVIDPAAVPADRVIRVSETIGTVQVRSSPSVTGNQIVFRPDGFARVGGNLLNANIAICLQVTRVHDNQRIIQLRSGSRLSTVSNDQNGQCPAASNPS